MWKLMKAAMTILGLIASIISVAKLISVGLTSGATGVLALCFKWWDSLLNVLFGWATPYVATGLLQLASWIPINVVLLEHWYHILVLMSLYVTGDIVADWSRRYSEASRKRARNRTVSAILTVIVGYPLAISVSAIAGTVDLTGTDRLGVIYAISGFVLYQLFRSLLNGMLFPHDDKSRWETIVHFFWRMPFMDVVCGLLALAIGTYGPMPNLLVLVIFVVLIAVLRNLLVPAIFVLSTKGADIAFWFRLATVRLGLRVLAVVLAAVVVVLGGAGF